MPKYNQLSQFHHGLGWSWNEIAVFFDSRIISTCLQGRNDEILANIFIWPNSRLFFLIKRQSCRDFSHGPRAQLTKQTTASLNSWASHAFVSFSGFLSRSEESPWFLECVNLLNRSRVTSWFLLRLLWLTRAIVSGVSLKIIWTSARASNFDAMRWKFYAQGISSAFSYSLTVILMTNSGRFFGGPATSCVTLFGRKHRERISHARTKWKNLILYKANRSRIVVLCLCIIQGHPHCSRTRICSSQKCSNGCFSLSLRALASTSFFLSSRPDCDFELETWKLIYFAAAARMLIDEKKIYISISTN